MSVLLYVLLYALLLFNAVLALAMRRQVNRELPPADRYPALYFPLDFIRKHRQLYPQSSLRTTYQISRVLVLVGAVALAILMFAHFRYS